MGTSFNIHHTDTSSNKGIDSQSDPYLYHVTILCSKCFEKFGKTV